MTLAEDPDEALRIVMALAFYPRGGSAQVARYLTRALSDHGMEVSLCSGSLGPPGSTSDANTFFADLDVHPLDFTEAVSWFEQGRDPMSAPVPMHPSFEDRPDVPDRVFASVDEVRYRHQVSVWRALLDRVGLPDVYHVHHLSHVNDAVLAFDDIPTVVHLHGTELKMLTTIRDGAPPSWRYSAAWQHRLEAAAHRANRLVVVSEADRDLAGDLLGVESVDVIPNGVDLRRFSSEQVPDQERMARWRHWLVEDPAGWDETGTVGSVSYSASEIEQSFVDPVTGTVRPVMMFVGRFLGFKRVPLLIRAYHRARAVLGPSSPPLVIWGGFPGEWEGEHPYHLATSLATKGVFFAGWRGHEDTSQALNCADVFVAPSVDEPFGQVYLEAMASGLPVIATNSGGPVSFVNTDSAHPNGWLVTPDSEADLAAAIVAAAEDATERQRRGLQGRRIVEQHYDWQRIAQRFEAVYREVLSA